MNYKENVVNAVMRLLKEPESKIEFINFYGYTEQETSTLRYVSYKGKEVVLFISNLKKEHMFSMFDVSFVFKPRLNIQISVYADLNTSNTATKIGISAWQNDVQDPAVQIVIARDVDVLNLDIDNKLKEILIDNIDLIHGV